MSEVTIINTKKKKKNQFLIKGGDVQEEPTIEMVVDPEILAQVEKETAAKLQELEAETGMAESEKAKISEQLRATDTKAEAIRRAKEEMAHRLAMMQQQLLVGGVNILDVHAKQEEQLRGITII